MPRFLVAVYMIQSCFNQSFMILECRTFPPTKKLSENLCEIFHRVDSLMGNQITLRRLKSTKLKLFIFLRRKKNRFLKGKKGNFKTDFNTMPVFDARTGFCIFVFWNICFPDKRSTQRDLSYKIESLPVTPAKRTSCPMSHCKGLTLIILKDLNVQCY